MSVRSAYDQELLLRGYESDPAQLQAVEALERCAQEWASYQEKLKSPLRFLKKKPELPLGVYMFGGVGRGKSFLMDCFYNAVPVKDKTRLHFHEFMREVHREMALMQGTVNPLQELGNVIATYNDTKASMDNFSTLMNAKSEEKPVNPKTMGAIQNLRFSNISFKHQTAKSHAIKNISFEVNSGETVAFVGPSGSGKTTLVKMLVGLYQPEEGMISYNDKNMKEIDLTELRKQLGFVTQDAQLFSGTIKDNLLFVKPDASDEEINAVLQKSACHNLLARAENGINTTIGEGGIKVSGGEKQRLSIARALLRNPKLLIFDEATSALDSITEEEITSTIRELSSMKQHITVMIAHRLSTILHADRIYVLELGKIIEAGTHEELLATKGLYYAMWRQQIGERQNTGKG